MNGAQLPQSMTLPRFHVHQNFGMDFPWYREHAGPMI